MFKSLKSKFSAACKKYLSDYPGRVVTTDALASLLGQESVTPVNAISGFRIYPLNAGVISDCHMAPSRAFVRLGTTLDNITPELEKLYQKCYEEGYDLQDPKSTLWLEAKRLQIASDHTDKVSASESASTASVVTICAPSSDRASLTASSPLTTPDF